MATTFLATYLWRRIREAGVQSVMGVPGDFNLNFLDHIFNVEGLKWVGNANELNAAYAADGYARIKKKPGCLVTTHGVGELSALNGVAGSACEHVPVIHVVGQTPMAAQENHLMIHHSIGFKPDHQLYNKISEHIRYSAAELASASDPCAEIDRVLRDCVIHSLPVYIFFPIDKTETPVPSSSLEKSLDLSLPTSTDAKDAAASSIIALLQSAKNASIFVDYLSLRYAQSETKALVEKLDLPHYIAHMGKGCISEDHPRFVGVYNGGLSAPDVAEAIEASDLVLSIGWFQCDTNTAFFSRKLPPEKTIQIMPDYVEILKKRYDNVYMAPLISHVTETIDPSTLTQPSTPRVGKLPPASDSQNITQDWVWDRLAQMLHPEDVVLADTGTATYGFPDIRFPHDVGFIAQSYYMSIGYTLPAALGVDMALREHHESGLTTKRGRTVLCIGDGSLMLTIQEVGNMIMQRLPVLIILINNAGYTIERAIHGAKQPYNDIPSFNYAHLLPLFSDPTKKEEMLLNYQLATTRDELDAALQKESIQNPQQTQVLEIRMGMYDIPWKLAKALNIRNPGYLKANGFAVPE